MCLVTEQYNEPLSLYYQSDSFTQVEFHRIGKELLKALTFLHEQHVPHNNLKTEHVRFKQIIKNKK